MCRNSIVKCNAVRLYCTALYCTRFDMEGDSLYSVKWYRNEQEFYRYVPNDRLELVRAS